LPPRPEVFAPGVISGPANDGAPTFSPDGKTLYFARSGTSWGFILESRSVNGAWTAPEIASFSGQWSDSQPAMAPDGSHLVFSSIRPAPGEKEEPGVKKERAAALWRVNKTATGWSEPVRLPESVNISKRVYKPSVAGDGSLYFMSPDAKTQKWRLYRSQYSGGTYAAATPLSFSDGTTGDVDPQVAPDESFLIFSSNGRRKDGETHERLYLTFREQGAWGEVLPMRYTGDDDPSDDGEANLSPDRKTLYFTSGRSVPIHFTRSREEARKDFERLNAWDNSNSNVWSMSLAPWLSRVKRGA
jgi:Tol biopolymer transport system component